MMSCRLSHKKGFQLVMFVVWSVIINIGIYYWKIGFDRDRQQGFLQRQRVDSIGNSTPRFDISTGGDTANYMRYVPDALHHRLIILSGMSQMYAINDQKDKDQTISEWMDDFIRAFGSRVFGLAAPNICNEEVLLLFLNMIQKAALKPAVFIYGLCFDKFRNMDLRPSYKVLLTSQPAVITRWKSVAGQYHDQYPKATDKMLTTLKDAINEQKKAGGSIEINMRQHLSNMVPVIAAREELNGWAQTQLYLLRNRILKIKPTSKRPQIPSRYEMNKEFLELLLDEAISEGVTPVIYIIPLNPQAENPYVPKEYEEFKAWAKSISEKKRVAFDNLENVVPHEDWGEFLGGPDFKHFRGTGHRRTAEELVRRFKSLLVPK